MVSNIINNAACVIFHVNAVVFYHAAVVVTAFVVDTGAIVVTEAGGYISILCATRAAVRLITFLAV